MGTKSYRNEAAALTESTMRHHFLLSQHLEVYHYDCFRNTENADMRRIKPELTALTCPCLLGILLLPRGVCLTLAALHYNGRSGVACQMPLAKAEKIIPRTCCVPDAFCRMSHWTKMAKGKRVGWGCAKRTRRGEEPPHTNPRRVFL